MAAQPQLGIDIGSTSIKLVELAPHGSGFKLLAAASMPSTGSIQANLTNLTPVVSAVARIVKESGAHSRKVVAALPEEQISSHIVQMPILSDAEIEQALEWQVEQYIPIPQDQAIWSHKILTKDAAGGTEVLLVAAAKSLVEAYRHVLEQAGLEVVALETELMASARAEVSVNSPLSVIVDMGAQSTDLGIVRGGELIFARTIPTAGEALSRALESSLGLDSTQAHQYLTTYGFAAGQLEGKILESLKPVLAVITGEIRKTIDFYTSKHPGEGVKQVILSGGVASLPDAVSAISAQVNMETIVGDPFMGVQMDDGQKKALMGNGPFYAVAVGLAKRV